MLQMILGGQSVVTKFGPGEHDQGGLHSVEMFILSEMQDIIRIEPWKFGLDMNHVITSILNKKFANKV